MEYSGTETGVAIDSAGVDWVRVSLRSGIGESSIVATRAVLLTETGDITELDGSRPVAFPGAPKSDLYVVVHHRDHLPVMSAFPVDFSSGGAAYDFTTSMTQAYSAGWDPMVEVGTGKFGLIAADVNKDGQITVLDFNLWLTSTKSALTGYLDEDIDLDQNVTTTDFNTFLMNTKAALRSQVPD